MTKTERQLLLRLATLVIDELGHDAAAVRLMREVWEESAEERAAEQQNEPSNAPLDLQHALAPQQQEAQPEE